VLDRQIVAWAVARGRRAQGHRLKQKKTQVRHIADLILNLKMRSSNYVKFNKWRKYGIKIRLHKYRLQQLDQRGPQNCSWLLLDSDGSGDAGRNRKELERNFIPDLIFTKNRKRTMDRGRRQRSFGWLKKLIGMEPMLEKNPEPNGYVIEPIIWLEDVQADVEQELQEFLDVKGGSNGQ
jgi:hypothetical protein